MSRPRVARKSGKRNGPVAVAAAERRKFENVSAGAALPFDRLTVIYGENARGKTTLAAILRSLSSGKGGPIVERRKLGARQPPHVVIDIDAGGPAVFQNGVWSRAAPDIAIFDDTFVAETSVLELKLPRRTDKICTN